VKAGAVRAAVDTHARNGDNACVSEDLERDEEADRERDEARKKVRKVWRDVLLSFAAAGIFGAFLVSYILKGTRIPDGPLLISQSDAALRGPDQIEIGQRVAGAFVAALRVGKLDEAYAQMARPYREGTSLETFRAAWKTSPLLANPQAVKLTHAHSEALQLPGGGFIRGATFTASGMLVAAAGALEVSFTFLREADDAHILAVFIGGIPVVQGIGPQGGANPSSSAVPTRTGSGKSVIPKHRRTASRTSRASATRSEVVPPP
jgi:hypothetical protein